MYAFIKPILFRLVQSNGRKSNKLKNNNNNSKTDTEKLTYGPLTLLLPCLFST